MNGYIKVFAPILLAILVGSLTYIFARSERGDVGSSPPQANKGKVNKRKKGREIL